MKKHLYLEIEGDPKKRGSQYGTGAKKQIHANIKFYSNLFEHYGFSWSRAKEVAKSYEAFIEDYLPEGIDEMKAIAEAAEVTYKDILALNCRSEIIFAKPDGCSSLGVLPELASSGHTYLGQTWDWISGARDNTVVLKITSDNAPTALICAEAGIIGGKGLNSAGIGVCLNALSVGKGGLGVPLHIMYRAILQQTIISNCIDCVAHPQRAGSGNFAIGSAEGFLGNVEYSPDNFDVLMAVDEFMCHTNHYLSPLFIAKDTFKRDICDTFVRLNRMQKMAKFHKGLFSEADIWSILSDHKNYPDSVCSHEDPKDPDGKRFCTMYGLLLDLTDRVMYMSDANPCEGEINTYRL